ncbi:MAG: redoxin domain-containing protein [Phycisphaerae bacterium]|nr:redoxin domain-containing protein [Gemmatimonadaceae bacterium]
MFSVSRSASFRALVVTCASAALLGPASLAAQVAAGTGDLAVGMMAPDFSIEATNASGVLSKPFKLSEHKGETIVLAFFPKARTRGCTVQMESYRDQYAELMNGGQKVTLVGISTDADSALTSWSKDAKFPFLFGSDEDKAVGAKYGANSGGAVHSRVLYVIGPDGKIAYVAAPFRQLDAAAYTDLGAAIDKAAGMK